MRRSVVWRWLLFTGLLATCLTTIGAAGARPSTERSAAQTPVMRTGSPESVRAAAKGNFGIPKPPNNPFQEPYDGKGVATNEATKLRTQIKLPETTFFSYLKLCTQVIQLGSDDPKNCPDFHPPKTTFDTFDNAAFPVWIDATGPIWIKSPAKSKLQYGSFAPVRVQSLAFGFVPISATVTISQPVGGDGFVRPLSVDYLTTASPVPAEGGEVFGTKRWDGFTFPANNGSFYGVAGFRINGPVDVRLSDLAVDEQPVPLDGDCTSSNGTIKLESPAGAYNSKVPATQLRGRPGGAQVLNSDDAGSIQGTVDIARFSGCRSGSENLDPLLTSFVSGRNPLDVAFTRPFTACGNTQRTEPCPPFPAAAPAPGARAATPAGQVAQSSAIWGRLTAGQRNEVTAKLAALPRKQRSLVLSSLPAPIASAVRAAR